MPILFRLHVLGDRKLFRKKGGIRTQHVPRTECFICLSHCLTGNVTEKQSLIGMMYETVTTHNSNALLPPSHYHNVSSVLFGNIYVRSYLFIIIYDLRY
jgi:hypothetical protein